LRQKKKRPNFKRLDYDKSPKGGTSAAGGENLWEIGEKVLRKALFEKGGKRLQAPHS